ncbi:hypothetical protein [uncultured Solobacterium sp.]|uniref:hypothetical protein n=1 Tax=uncultured Solobacterium sp. TaxID=747375 RepID=UPI0034541170
MTCLNIQFHQYYMTVQTLLQLLLKFLLPLTTLHSQNKSNHLLTQVLGYRYILLFSHHHTLQNDHVKLEIVLMHESIQ